MDIANRLRNGTLSSSSRNRPFLLDGDNSSINFSKSKTEQKGRIQSKAAYVVLGITLDGFKEVLGIWIGESESSKFWLMVLNELKNRGVNDILITCTDNLTGFSEAIQTTFPQTELQKCIVHQIRNSLRFVN